MLFGRRGPSGGPSEPPETRIGGTGYARPRRIPARARAAALAPRTCRYRAHSLRLDVHACRASSRASAACRSLASSPFRATWHNRGHSLSRVPCAWGTRPTWMGARAQVGDRTFGAARDEDRAQNTSWGSSSGASSSHMPASSSLWATWHNRVTPCRGRHTPERHVGGG